MNLSSLYHPFELAQAWPRPVRHEEPAPTNPVPALTDLQRRLVVLHVAQATPPRPPDARSSWPGTALVCSLVFAGLAIITGAWQ